MGKFDMPKGDNTPHPINVLGAKDLKTLKNDPYADLGQVYNDQIGEDEDDSAIKDASKHMEKDRIKEMNELGKLAQEKALEEEENMK